MATNFEWEVAQQILKPWNTLAFSWFKRHPVDALADAFDRRLFEGQSLKYGDLFRRQLEHRAPLLIINATSIHHPIPDHYTGLPTPPFGLFVFTKDKSRDVFVVTERPYPGLRRSTREWRFAGRVGTRPIDLEPFEGLYGKLEEFPVAHAVAASAGYPGLLGTVRLRDESSGHRELGDAGLIDNSGLLSLYAHVFRRELFAKGNSNRLKRVLVFAIDASQEARPSLLSTLYGLHEFGQNSVQRFVLPEMINRIEYQDLVDVFDESEWNRFRIENPFFFHLGVCSLLASENLTKQEPTIDLSFRLSSVERTQIGGAAEECYRMEEERLVSWIEGEPEGIPTYSGIVGPPDRQAWGALFELGMEQIRFKQITGRYARIDELQDSELRYRSELGEAIAHFDSGKVDRTGHRFEIVLDGTTLWIYATPKQYKQSGRVSLVLRINEEYLEDPNRCMNMYKNIRGYDHRGDRASPDDPIFVPNGVVLQPCF